jgi:hypothetical protein
MNIKEAEKIVESYKNAPQTLRLASGVEFMDKRIPLWCPDCKGSVQRMPVIDLMQIVCCTNLVCHFKEGQPIIIQFDKSARCFALADEAITMVIVEYHTP